MGMKPKHIYEFGPFRLDATERVLLREGKPVLVPPKDLETLLVLVENRGHLVEKNELLERVWPGTFVEEGNLAKHISNLRQLLGDGLNEITYIETIPTRGYRFLAPANELEQVPAQTAPGPAPGRAVPAERGRRWWIGAVVTAALLAVLVAVWPSSWRGRLFGRGERPIRSIAVLPLENLSRDAEQEYFADGMTDALITDLARVSALRVISRTSAMQYKGARKPLRQIAQELGVDALVEGTVARSGDRVRITANLVQASPERHLWAESYERDLRDVLVLQSSVATAIAREVRVKVTPQEQARLSSARRVNPEGYEAYLRGRAEYLKMTPESLTRAVEYFNQAIAKDPDQALAYIGLSKAYTQLAGRAFPPTEVMPKAKAAALRSLELDDRLAEGHSQLGVLKLIYEHDWSGAGGEFKRALELDPSNPGPGYIFYLSAIGRHDEAIAEIGRAQQLDPLAPISHYHCGRGRLLYYARRFDQAIEEFRKGLEMEPGLAGNCQWLGLVYEQKGMRAEAITELQKAVIRSPHDTLTLANLVGAYVLAGKRAEARRMLNQLLALTKERYVSPYDLAILYIGLDDNDQALKLLDKAVEGRLGLLVYLNVDPVFDPLRSDPRFQALLRRMGLPP